MNGVTVWIKASPEEHMARVGAKGDRHSMKVSAEAMGDLRSILATREALNSQADITIDTTDQSQTSSFAQLRAG